MKLSEKSRKLLRAVYRGLGAAGISVTLGACPFPFVAMYGPPSCCEAECVILTGQVRSNTGQPLSGISVWINDGRDWNTVTNSDGYFFIHLDEGQSEFTVVFTDIDGEANGLFKQLTMNITREAAAAGPITVELEAVEGTAD